MDRFDLIGFRTDERYLYIDISHRDNQRDTRALAGALEDIRSQTGAQPIGAAPQSAQRYAFTRLVTEILHFTDEDNFRPALSDAERQGKLRSLAASMHAQMTDVVQEYRRRKVTTFSVRKPEDPNELLKRLRSLLRRL